MRTNPGGNNSAAFTIIDAMIVIVTVVLVAGFLLPALTRPKRYGCRNNCVSNLKQVGLAMRMFSNDHEDKFPWAVSKTNGGTMEYSNSVEVFRHFLAVSNELASPRILLCPQEKERVRVSDWGQLSNSNVSYFVGLDGDETKPQTILSGDRTLSIRTNAWRGVMVITEPSSLRVLPGLHGRDINIGLSDGSAQMLSEKQVKEAVSKLRLELGETPVRLSVP